MSHDDARAAIESRFKTQWSASAYSAVPIWYENQKQPTNSGRYVAISIIGTGGDQASIGAPDARLTRYTGLIQVDVITEEFGATADLHKMADVAASIFRYAEFSLRNSGTIVCGVDEQINMSKAGANARRVVRVPFYRDIIG